MVLCESRNESNGIVSYIVISSKPHSAGIKGSFAMAITGATHAPARLVRAALAGVFHPGGRGCQVVGLPDLSSNHSILLMLEKKRLVHFLLVFFSTFRYHTFAFFIISSNAPSVSF
jgi:hypothetical protein